MAKAVRLFDPYHKPIATGGWPFGRLDFLPRLPNSERGLLEPDPDFGEIPPVLVSGDQGFLYLEQGGVAVADFETPNGTFLNGVRITSRTLIPWDELLAARVYAGAECFCLRFVRLMEVILVSGTRKLAQPIPENHHIYSVVVGRYLSDTPRVIIQMIMEEDEAQDHEQTIAPGALQMAALGLSPTGRPIAPPTVPEGQQPRRPA